MKAKIVTLLCLLALLVSACGPKASTPAVSSATPSASTPAAPTAISGPSPTPILPQSARPSGFAAYQPVRVEISPSVPGYDFDLATVARPDDLAGLNAAQRAALEKNGFVVVPQGHTQIYKVYQNAKQRGETIFVTTDSILHAYHILYDYSLRSVEFNYLYNDLKALTAAMLQASQEQMQSAPNPKVSEAAKLNVAFFAVASTLLDPNFAAPSDVSDLVKQEIDLIEAHAGLRESPLLRVKEDYSQYVPRGHYTRNETFQRYFKAMMWYGRVGFLSTHDDIDIARRHTRQALLITTALSTALVNGQPALKIWDRIYEPTVFYVGSADDLTIYDYQQVAHQVYQGLPALGVLDDDQSLDAFRQATAQLPPPRIVGGLVTDQQDTVQTTRGFRFMGQRFIPDSYIFQQLVYNQVTRYTGSGMPFTLSVTDAGAVRGFARGLDIPAVLGSKRALDILQAEGDTEYDGYDKQLSKLQLEFKELSLQDWTQNLYWNWLYSLQPLLDEKSQGYPAFMQNPAWADKDLHTYLGSWAELRHDTILYAKQSYAVGVTSVRPEPPPASAYVEPQPEVYARLAALTAQMQSGLGSRGLLEDAMSNKLITLHQLLLDLKAMSEKELRGETLTSDEVEQLRNIGDILEQLTTFSAQTQKEIASETDERMAIVADVHTDPNTGLVLEEGVGDAFVIIVLVPIGKDVQAAHGGVFSYYEFKQPMDNRLTDEAWQKLDPRPAQPAWTSSFIVP